jgi:hypothetical protein
MEENFPELIVKPKIIKNKETQNKETQNKEIQNKEMLLNVNYIDKLNFVKQINNDVNNEEDIVDPGWVKLEKNKITKIVTIKYGKKTYISDDEKIVNPTDVLYKLIQSHEKRKNDYIHDWGEESYENTFRCINYDYDYFENLDDEYEITQIEDEHTFDEESEYEY